MDRAMVRSLAFATLTAALAAALTAALPLAAQADPPGPAVAAEPTAYPSLRPDTSLPVYPPSSRRHKEAGVIKLALCVDAAGGVTKADVTHSSGFPNLDKAVLKWIRGVEMNPAMQGATPVAICDIPFSYEFKVTKGPDQLQTRTTNTFDVGPPSH